MDGAIGLIVKGGTALFLQGPDPGKDAAQSIISRYRVQDFDVIAEYGLLQVPRPSDLSVLSWKYGFFVIGKSQPMRLEPGPFDTDLQDLVKTLDG